MTDMAPPNLPPLVALDDHGDLGRLRRRLWQISMSILTILVTAWCFKFGAFAAIVAVLVAKHVLVAILMMGLGMDQPRTVRE